MDWCEVPLPVPVAPRVSPDGGLIYEIYVRSFQDSDGDGIGDLAGVASRLDYLAALGVGTLWLMPVFPSGGVAGYDVMDFDTVNADYGSEEDLAALVEDAHALGMTVLIDLPFNHVAREHPWFAAAEDGGARDRFLFSDRRCDPYRWFPADGGGWYYAFFGAELPDLDWTGPVREPMEEVLARWLDAGVDGYRLDAVPTLIEADGDVTNTDPTHALLAELVAGARDDHPDAFFLSEASEDDLDVNLSYLGSPSAPESDRVLDFPRRVALLESAADGDAGPIRAVLQAQLAADVIGRTATFLGSHDVSRLPSEVPSAAARRALRVAQLLLPGDPVLYYGEELDLADTTSGTGQDYIWRAPMPWDATGNGGFTTGLAWFTPDPGYLDGVNVEALLADPDSVLTLVRSLACVRGTIAEAGWELLATDRREVLAFERERNGERVVVAINLGARALDVEVEVVGGFRDVTAGGARVDAPSGLRIVGMPAYGYRILADGRAEQCDVPGPG